MPTFAYPTSVSIDGDGDIRIDTRGEPPRSRSPSPDRRPRDRSSASPVRRGGSDRGRPDSAEASRNPGNNLFVTGLGQRTRETDLERAFGKFGEIERCQIMYDPHTRDSRGFAFVSFVRLEDADRAVEESGKLDVDGRIVTVERAKRSRARTPTPGRYYGPPKREGSVTDRDRRDRDSYDRRDRHDRYAPRDRYDDRRDRGSRDDRRDRYDDRDRRDRDRDRDYDRRRR
ncbi:uncharacterized protein SPPG_08972 [Spizellomyces punctatus DAOM BR117]|uniref:RRM domain-containing protein n=1 Tax=Spizellomyces punctatus (strain DAOM BR117) TaxID=645134 RepID=A0A0L0HPQ9_SPIPD|nr:uncharacterized protein SPPG_08972 [Spizellomyces punctatus DAOM BR117]KND02955.1 hypothetical protein SPPG_08972 [Spizellomyces punctatus DAOM BR117]|eukprot:XP_016610994.1 hypothetical protein SPPG_08972 [Spizellomyces punctatus DAOM BR117]